jgi:DNA repair ATPase RecN
MPNLVGTQSLRELQDLITAEKSILQSHERLANDISKGCNAMATWGASEGSDLSDVLSHASAILMHLSNAMNKYADHEASIRLLYKSIRTKEEQLEDMVKRRKQLGSRAEKEEKKLAKMSQEVGVVALSKLLSSRLLTGSCRTRICRHRPSCWSRCENKCDK